MGSLTTTLSAAYAVSAEALKEVIEGNIAATVATIGLVIYFVCTAAVFITNPVKFGRQYSVQPVDNAGKTEIRVYYGGISFALGLFLALLAFVFGHPFYSLVGGLVFANTVFFTRFVFTFVDTCLPTPCFSQGSYSRSWTKGGAVLIQNSPSRRKERSLSCCGYASR